MAKSLRSKVKRAFRSKKREDGIYAATEAARLHRLNARLSKVIAGKNGEDNPLEDSTMDEDLPEGEILPDETAQNNSEVQISASLEKPARISTHGPRNSRREQWRKSKGLAPKPKSNHINRQGVVAARSKAGRSHRRR